MGRAAGRVCRGQGGQRGWKLTQALLLRCVAAGEQPWAPEPQFPLRCKGAARFTRAIMRARTCV